MRKWLFGILIMGLLLLGCTLSISDFGVPSKFDMSASALIQTATEVINRQLTTTQHAFGFPTSSHLQPTADAFQQTATELIRTVTEGADTESSCVCPLATANPQSSADAFQLTATKIIADATQTAEYIYADCEMVTVTSWEIFYRVSNAQLSEYTKENVTYSFYHCPDYPERYRWEYTLIIATDDLSNRNLIIQSIEYVISQLSLYPPDDVPLQNEHLVSLVIFFDDGDIHYQVGVPFEFTYEDAIAAYESGLRGAELLDALGIEVPE